MVLMGRFQPAKVNPELKQYFVLSNFSGGINTEYADEVMQDYESRALVNVDLAKTGTIQRRKGWGADNVLQNLLNDTTVVNDLIGGDTLLHVELISDEYNSLSRESLGEFYKISLLFITYRNSEVQDLVRFNRVTLENDVPVDVAYAGVINIGNYNIGAMNELKFIVNTIRNVDKLYFALSDIGYNRDTKQGLGIYSIDSNTISAITPASDSFAYKPIPYEVMSIGFNALSVNPLTFMDTTDLTPGFYGVLVTDTENKVVYNKLPSTEFHLHVITTGLTKDQVSRALTPNLFSYYNFTEQEFEDMRTLIPYVSTWVSGETGVIVYKIKFSQGLINGKTISLKLMFTDTEPITYAQTRLEIKNIYDFVNEGPIGEHFLMDDGSSVGLYLKNSSTLTLIAELEAIISGPPPFPGYYYNPSTNPENAYYYDGSSYTTYKLIKNPEDGYIFYKYLPALGEFYFIVSEAKLYYSAMIGGKFELLEDFDTQTYVFENDYFAGTVSDGAPIKSLLQSTYARRARLYKAGNNLIMYAGNTIAWSEANNFEYFPAPNYKVFPLDSDDEITSISYFRGSHLIFTKKTIWKMSGNLIDPTNVSFTLLSDSIGCIAPKSVRNFENTTIFLSKDGLYRVKQAYYMEGMENVEKIDKHAKNLVPYDEDAEATLVDEQYWLFTSKNLDYDVIRYYYTIDIPNGHPFVVDFYGGETITDGIKEFNPENKPSVIFKLGNGLYSVRGNKFYKYGVGYYDFLQSTTEPGVSTEDQILDASYTTTIVTANVSFGYPTHTKKMKSLYVKTNSSEPIPFYISIALDNETEESLTTMDWIPVLNPTTGSIEYVQVDEPNIELIGQSMDPTAVLDYFLLNRDTLNSNTPTQLVKLPFSGKGRNVKVMIKQKTPAPFSIENIGFLFKLGKVRENRR